MKKINLFSIIMLVALLLVSCNDGEKDNGGGDTPPIEDVPAIIEGKCPFLLVNQKFGIKEVLKIENSEKYNDTILYAFNDNQQLRYIQAHTKKSLSGRTTN